MSQEPNSGNAVEQVVARALRDNLERIQRNSDELHQAIADVVAACSSAKPTNALPPMLRAQAGAASLGAVLEVLSKFVAVTLQPGSRSPYEAEIARLAGAAIHAPAPAVAAEPVASVAPVVAQQHPVVAAPPAQHPIEVEHQAEPVVDTALEVPVAAEAVEAEHAPVAPGDHEQASSYDVARLP